MLRASILAPEEDRGYRRWSDLLVDVARDSLSWAFDNDELAARHVVETWFRSDAPLLRRLAVHGLSRAGWLTADDKLHLVLGRGLFFERTIRPEIVGLIRDNAGDVGPDLVDDVLSTVDAGPPGIDDPLQADIARQRLLMALRDAWAEAAAVEERLGRIASDHAELATEPEAEAPEVSITEWAGPRSPRSVESLLETDPADPTFLDFLVSYDKHGWDESREGLLNVLEVAARRAFGWFMDLAKSLAARGAWDSDLLRRLIGSWSELSLAPDEWRLLFDFLEGDPHKDAHSHEISDLLEKALRGSDEGLPYGLLDRAEELGQTTWAASRANETDDPSDDDWLGRAINRTAGKLILFFVRALSERRSEDGIGEIPEPVRSVFGQALMQETSHDRLGAVVLASQSHFLHSLDLEWAREALLPVFNWNADADVARRSWNGFLTWGGLPPPLVEDLMPFYVQTTSHLPQMSLFSK